MEMQFHERLARWFFLGLLALLAPLGARAEGDPPGRVGRIVDFQGQVSTYDHQQGQWVPALRNVPLISGDRVSTDGYARAQLQIGSTTLRLGAGTEFEVLRLDDEQLSFRLHSGSLALRVRSREVARETEILTQEARLRPLRSGHFRIDRVDDSTFAGSWRGELLVDEGSDSFVVDSGRRTELWREGAQHALRHEWSALQADEFADWVAREDQQDALSVSSQYVSPEMTGAEDLDRNGRWLQHPDYGALWMPLVVAVDWAPYRYGHWAWIAPWGWTWVDDAPWGFAPFHYGRWLRWGGHWCWAPGPYVPRPVFAPALVAWVGGPHLSVSISVGGPLLPAVGWVPLAPREVFVPYYAATPVYVDRVNHRQPGRPRPPPQVPTGPIMYGNQGVPGAVTVVPQNVLMQRQPVARAVVEVRQPLQRVAPPVPVQPAAGPQPGARPVWSQPSPAPAQRVVPPQTSAPAPVPAARPQPVPPPNVPPPPARSRPPSAPAAPQVVPVPGGAVPAARPPAANPRPPQSVPPVSPSVAPPQVVVPMPAPGVARVPAPPAAPPAAAVPAKPTDNDDGRMRTPESRANMRDREQQR
jgi:hypothetical protein